MESFKAEGGGPTVYSRRRFPSPSSNNSAKKHHQSTNSMPVTMGQAPSNLCLTSDSRPSLKRRRFSSPLLSNEESTAHQRVSPTSIAYSTKVAGVAAHDTASSNSSKFLEKHTILTSLTEDASIFPKVRPGYYIGSLPL